ncbi:MAG: hypothetical protein HC863_02275 [Myxococcales bacterium]|nr:hypothetical protein [Myxococcales bacterium]
MKAAWRPPRGIYHEWRPVGPLADQLACTWTNALPEKTAPLQIIPDGCIDIVWTGESLRVAGPDTQPVFESFAAGTLTLTTDPVDYGLTATAEQCVAPVVTNLVEHLGVVPCTP